MTAIPCPHCRKGILMVQCEDYSGHVTYWGEEAPAETECRHCRVTIYLKEHVARTWSVGRTPDEADDVMADEFDGVPA